MKMHNRLIFHFHVTGGDWHVSAGSNKKRFIRGWDKDLNSVNYGPFEKLFELLLKSWHSASLHLKTEHKQLSCQHS